MSLLERFKKYLDEQFHSIKPTKEAMEYKEEVLSTLLDHAQSYRDEGEFDEDVIYDKCIAGLGDFQSTLQIFEKRRADLKKAALKASQITLISVAAMFLITVAYLVTSLVTKAWSKTWVMEVGGAFLVVIANLAIGIAPMIKFKKYMLLRFASEVIITLLYILVYLLLVVLVPQLISRTWLIFFLMIISWFLLDTIICYATGLKNWGFVSFLFLIMSLGVFLYVSLALLGVITWSIYWVLPVAAAAIDLMLIAIKYALKRKK